MGASLIDVVRTRKAELETLSGDLKAKRAALVDNAIAEKRAMTTEEESEYTEHTEKREANNVELHTVSERLSELEADAKREKEAGEVRGPTPSGGAQVTDPPIYARDKGDTSYFRDLFNATRRGDPVSAERIRRNNKAEKETRALSTTATDGGEFAPPLWLVEDYVKLARQARVTIETFDSAPLPSGISTVNVPKVSTGTSTAVQATENSALSETDLVSSSLSSGITTVGGKQVVSLQLLEQSGIPFDRVILGDLSSAHAVTLNTQGIMGTGSSGQLRGLNAAAGLTTQTYTDASATGAELVAEIAKAMGTVHANRFLPATAIVMHPRRWAFLVGSTDTNGRPFVVPNPYGPQNVFGVGEQNVPQGVVGNLLGAPVYTDASIPVNQGTGTNEDLIFVYHAEDIKLWESPIRAEAFESTYADSAGVLFRLLNFSALIPDRYGSAVVKISGTGLVTP